MSTARLSAFAVFVVALAGTTVVATPAESFIVCKDAFETVISNVATVDDANGTASCLALDDLARCIGTVQAELADAGKADDGQQYSLYLQYQETTLKKYDCAAAVSRVVPPSISTVDKDLVLSTDGRNDVKFMRYRRDSVSIWDIVAQVNELTRKGLDLETAYVAAVNQVVADMGADRAVLQTKLARDLATAVTSLQGDLSSAEATLREEMNTKASGIAADVTAKVGELTIKVSTNTQHLEAVDKLMSTTADNINAVEDDISKATASAAANKQGVSINAQAIGTLQATTGSLSVTVGVSAASIKTLQGGQATQGGRLNDLAQQAASSSTGVKNLVDLTQKQQTTLTALNLLVNAAKSQSSGLASKLDAQIKCASEGRYLKNGNCAAAESISKCDSGAVGAMAVVSDFLSVCATGKKDGTTVYAWKSLASTKLEFDFGGSADSPANSCDAIFQADRGAETGLYWIQSSISKPAEKLWCLMNVKGGGWTLVASVHEDNRNARGNANDRWSSQRGYDGGTYGLSGGPRNWESDSTFNKVEQSAQDDFKSWAYSYMQAKDLMVLNIQSGTSWQDFWSRTSMAQATTNEYLSNFSPANLAGVFRRHKLRHGCANQGNDNMRSVEFIKGSRAQMESWTCPNCKGESEPGAFAFSQCNCEGSRFAFCQVQRQGCNIEHFCIGSSFVSGHGLAATNDFNGWDWHYLGEGWSRSWAVSEQYYSHTVTFLYK